MIEPNMAPFIALAWLISASSLGALTLWAAWRFGKRGQ